MPEENITSILRVAHVLSRKTSETTRKMARERNMKLTGAVVHLLENALLAAVNTSPEMAELVRKKGLTRTNIADSIEETVSLVIKHAQNADRGEIKPIDIYQTFLEFSKEPGLWPFGCVTDRTRGRTQI